MNNNIKNIKDKYPESEGWITAKLTMKTADEVPESEIRKFMFGNREETEIVEYRQTGKQLSFIYREKKDQKPNT